MTDIEILIQTADRLCNHLDCAAQQEHKFNQDICLLLENMSWESLKMKHQLEEIKAYVA